MIKTKLGLANDKLPALLLGKVLPIHRVQVTPLESLKRHSEYAMPLQLCFEQQARLTEAITFLVGELTSRKANTDSMFCAHTMHLKQQHKSKMFICLIQAVCGFDDSVKEFSNLYGLMIGLPSEEVMRGVEIFQKGVLQQKKLVSLLDKWKCLTTDNAEIFDKMMSECDEEVAKAFSIKLEMDKYKGERQNDRDVSWAGFFMFPRLKHPTSLQIEWKKNADINRNMLLDLCQRTGTPVPDCLRGSCRLNLSE